MKSNLTNSRANSAIFVLLASLAASLEAAPVKKEQAAKAATTHIVKHYPVRDKEEARTVTGVGSSPLRVKKTDPVVEADQTIGYVATLEPAGYVLLSADDEAPAVKLHSDNGAFDNLPPAIITILQSE